MPDAAPAAVPQTSDVAAPTSGAPFPNAAMPARESRARLLGIRFATALALLAGAVYLGWRALETVNLSVWWLAVPLLLLKAHALLGLLLHAAGLWNLHSVTPPAHVEQTDLRLAVLIPTCDEPREVLPTIAAAVAVRLPHQTWVLDDGNRPAVGHWRANSAPTTSPVPIEAMQRPATSTTPATHLRRCHRRAGPRPRRPRGPGRPHPRPLRRPARRLRPDASGLLQPR